MDFVVLSEKCNSLIPVSLVLEVSPLLIATLTLNIHLGLKALEKRASFKPANVFNMATVGVRLIILSLRVCDSGYGCFKLHFY